VEEENIIMICFETININIVGNMIEVGIKQSTSLFINL